MLDAIVIGVVALVALVAAAVIAREKVADAAGNFADNPLLKTREESQVIGSVISEPVTVLDVRKPSRDEAFRNIDRLAEFFGEQGNTEGVHAAKLAGLALFSGGKFDEVPNDGE